MTTFDLLMWKLPYGSLLRKHRSKIIWSTFLFWLLLGALVYLSEIVAHTFFNAPAMDSIEVRQYLLRWILWLLFTPLIIFLGLKINIGTFKLGWFILLHMCLGSLVLFLEFSIEVAILKPLAEVYYQRTVSINEMIIPFLSKYFAYVVNYFLMIGMVNMYVYMQTYFQTKQNLLLTELQNQALNHELTMQHLEKLKMQIRPHFLFNSFNALNALIITKQEEKAEFMLSKLSELLRRTLDTSVQEFITVREEVNHLDLYMDIQRLRFGQRMVYQAHMEEEAEQALIPFFILQPVVENAIQYSIEISDQPIDLDIRVYKEQTQLMLEVRNTFCALPVNDRQGHGIGLSNVRDRLFRHYGESAHLDLKINQNGVTLVQINLPYASS